MSSLVLQIELTDERQKALDYVTQIAGGSGDHVSPESVAIDFVLKGLDSWFSQMTQKHTENFKDAFAKADQSKRDQIAAILDLTAGSLNISPMKK